MKKVSALAHKINKRKKRINEEEKKKKRKESRREPTSYGIPP